MYERFFFCSLFSVISDSFVRLKVLMMMWYDDDGGVHLCVCVCVFTTECDSANFANNAR